MNSVVGFTLVVVAALGCIGIEAKIPDYIQVCKRNDPEISACIQRSIENLRPKLKSGIPELDVPPLEPLHIPEIVISRGGAFRAVGKNVVVHGASDFQIKSLKADVEKLEYQADLYIPKLSFEALYDVNMRLVLPIVGKGTLKANASDVTGNAFLKGKKVQRNGKTIVEFEKLDLKFKMKSYTMRLENLFNGDKALGEAVNTFLNENRKDIAEITRPRAEEIISNVLLDIAQKITEHFEYDELFPLN